MNSDEIADPTPGPLGESSASLVAAQGHRHPLQGRGQVEEGLLESTALGAQLVEHNPQFESDPADRRESMPLTSSRPSGATLTVAPSPVNRVGRRPQVLTGDADDARRSGDQFCHAQARHQPAGGDQHDMVCGLLHLIHQVTRDEHGATLGCDVGEHTAHPDDALGIKTVEWFVQDQHRRTAQQGDADGQPLLHAERKGADPTRTARGEAHLLQHLIAARRRDARGLGGPAKVRARRSTYVHGVRIEHRPHHGRRAAEPGVLHAVHQRSPSGGPIQAEDHPHRRRLARSIGSDEARHGPGRHLEAQICTAVTAPNRLVNPSTVIIDSLTNWSVGKLTEW